MSLFAILVSALALIDALVFLLRHRPIFLDVTEDTFAALHGKLNISTQIEVGFLLPRNARQIKVMVGQRIVFYHKINAQLLAE